MLSLKFDWDCAKFWVIDDGNTCRNYGVAKEGLLWINAIDFDSVAINNVEVVPTHIWHQS